MPSAMPHHKPSVIQALLTWLLPHSRLAKPFEHPTTNRCRMTRVAGLESGVGAGGRCWSWCWVGTGSWFWSPGVVPEFVALCIWYCAGDFTRSFIVEKFTFGLYPRQLRPTVKTQLTARIIIWLLLRWLNSGGRSQRIPIVGFPEHRPIASSVCRYHTS